MRGYSEEATFELEKVWFPCADGQYSGRGVMTWKPTEGFHIEAFVKRHGPPLASPLSLGRTGLIPQHCVRMRPEGYIWAFTPAAVLDDDMRVIENNRLSIDVDTVTLCQRHDPGREISPHGDILCAVRAKPRFPDHEEAEIRIGGERFGSESKRAIVLKEQGLFLRGRILNDRTVELTWSFPETIKPKTYCWEWCFSLVDALSIMQGEDVQLLRRNMHVGQRSVTEINKRSSAISLGLLSPFGPRSWIDAKSFAALAAVLAKDDVKADVCRRIFGQLIEARKQTTWQAMELLIATILEASLRTIFNEPFVPGKKGGFALNKWMNAFRERYLAPGTSTPQKLTTRWENACKKVVEARDRLRHRNAHADWLEGHGGSISDAQMSQAEGDMVVLVRFYGYVIKALAGHMGLEPDLIER